MIEKQIRFFTFWFLVAVTFASWMFAAVYDVRWTGNDYDACLVMYGSNIFIALACAVLFTAHWMRAGRASEVFMFVTLLFYTMVLDYGLQFFVRYCAVCNGFLLPSNIWWWELRSMPRLVIRCYMFGLILGRMFGEKDK